MATVPACAPEPAEIPLWQRYIDSCSAELRLELLQRYLPWKGALRVLLGEDA